MSAYYIIMQTPCPHTKKLFVHGAPCPRILVLLGHRIRVRNSFMQNYILYVLQLVLQILRMREGASKILLYPCTFTSDMISIALTGRFQMKKAPFYKTIPFDWLIKTNIKGPILLNCRLRKITL